MLQNSHSKLRTILIALLFILGLFFVIFGWTFKGKAIGLLLMIIGVIFILAALFTYNAPYGNLFKK